MVLKSQLEQAGVTAVLHNVNLSEPVVSAGVRVRIREKDLPQALAVVESQQPPTCKVSPTRLWLFMTCHGYYRMIDPESTDLVGQYIHLNKCFVEYIDAKSIIQAAKTMLLEYIKQAWRHNDNERRLMSDCANMVDKSFIGTYYYTKISR